MISFVDVEGAADETAAEERVSIEAAESNNRALYERALRLQGDGRDGEAAASPLVRRGVWRCRTPAGSERTGRSAPWRRVGSP